MPRLIPTRVSESPRLLALRRTLWQLSVLGIGAAATLAQRAPQFGTFALWCALIPLSALATHYRRTLLHAVSTRLQLGSAQSPRRRSVRPRPQARRAIGSRATTKPQQVRARHATG